jgi:2-hydroxy-6-oxonona-2,4-dienedioate hydrolase
MPVLSQCQIHPVVAETRFGTAADNGKVRYQGSITMTASTAKPETANAENGAPDTMVPAAAFPSLAARTAGAGPVLVLLHGGTGSSAHWVRNIDALADKFRVVAFDLPAYGDSPDVPKAITTDDYIGWVRHAVVTAAPDGCHLAGFSFGGAVAARVAAQLGHRIIRLSLLGTGGFGVPVGRVIPLARTSGAGAGTQARRDVAAANLGQWMLSSAPGADDPVVDMQLANIDRARFDSRRISHEATLLDDLTHITAPVQLIWGTADKLAYPSIQSRVESCRRVRPDVSVALVTDGGHWAQYEQADAVNRLLMAFHGA